MNQPEPHDVINRAIEWWERHIAYLEAIHELAVDVGSGAVSTLKIKTAKRTVEALQLEAATGKVHCVCCLALKCIQKRHKELRRYR